MTLVDIVNRVRRCSSYNNDNHVHHIVPQTHSGTQIARAKLIKAGIDPVTDERNLILIRQNLHAHIHTGGYVGAIENIFKMTNDATTIPTLASIKVVIGQLNNWVNSVFN